MKIVKFLVGSNDFSVYRTVAGDEADMLNALLGDDFCFGLDDGDPMDDFLFNVLSQAAMGSTCYLIPPPNANLIGTFKLSDGRMPSINAEDLKRSSARRSNEQWEGGWTH